MQIALGCEALGGTDWGNVDLDVARDAVRCALQLGVTTFDTADVYGLGRSETELSCALGDDRHRVTIVTKGGLRWSSDGTSGRAAIVRDSSASYLSSAIENSLRRLRIDAIPLYLVHWPDDRTPIDETLDCLERAREAGKIRAYGLSNFGASIVSDLSRSYPVRAVEGPLSLIDRESLLDDYKTMRRAGLLVLTYGPLAQGLLSGKYSAGSVFAETDRRGRLSHFLPASWERNERILQTLRQVSREAGRTFAQVAIRWVLQSGASSVVIVGARSPVQVTENVASLDWSLGDQQFQRLTAAGRP